MLPKLKIVSYLSAADWWVFFGVLALTLAAALYGHYRKKRPKNKALDYLLMGRQLTLPLFVATLVATWYGGIFGVNEITFNYGIYNFVTQGFFWYIAYLIFAFFIAEKVAKYHSVTLPDLAGRMFGPKAAKVAAVFTFFYITPVAYVLSLGLFLNMAFGMSVLQGMIYGTLFVCLYTMWGGFKSVVFSDLVQFFVMCSSVLIVVLFSVHPAVSPNYLLFVFHPLHLFLGVPMTVYCGLKKTRPYYHYFNASLIGLFLILWLFLPQEFNNAVFPLALLLLLRSVSAIYCFRKNVR